MRLCFVVHRTAPFPGGSETYVQNMAEEAVRRGHDVTIFAGEHQGPYNGVFITDNPSVLTTPFDLIIVHGGDVNVQNFVLYNIKRIQSPVLYMLILPSESSICLQGIRDAALVGYSTHADLKHCEKHNVANKAVHIRHGITEKSSKGQKGFKEKYGITKRMFLTCGGYWPNKAINELVTVFNNANLDDSILVTTGYDNRFNIMPHKTDKVLPLLLNDRQEVLNAMVEADCVLMHSFTEGFGLVLLESMINCTPWISRNIAGAELMKSYGKVYNTDNELVQLLKNFNTTDFNVKLAESYVLSNHLISHTIDDIELAVKKLNQLR